jgi:hypothetical protein
MDPDPQPLLLIMTVHSREQLIHSTHFAPFLSSSSFFYCRHPHVAGLAAELSELQAKIQPAQREVKIRE